MVTRKFPMAITMTDVPFQTTALGRSLRPRRSAGCRPYRQAISFVKGIQFEDWQGNALAAGLGAKVIVRIEIDGAAAKEVERYDMDTRIRSVLEGPQGALWALEDERGSSKGRLLKLSPK